MRSSFIQFLPYLLIISLLFIPKETQEKISLHIQEDTHVLHSFFSSSKQDKAESGHGSLTIAPNSQEEEELSLFHESLDGFSPWMAAHIVCHGQTPWTHTAWIDIGSSSSPLLFPIERNCPVVFGKALVGIVERVGTKTSLIRLLSDPLLRPSVQVLRTGYDYRIEEAISYILRQIALKPTLLPKENHQKALKTLLLTLKKTLKAEKRYFFAKGELQGSSSLYKPHIFRGIGFNYDTGDELGPPRDIRTGQVGTAGPKIPLIQPNDLLVTNGLDGMYPRGLEAAYVEQVSPLEEGGVAYEITAKAACPSFLDLHTIAILPPLPQEKETETADLEALLHEIDQEIGSTNDFQVAK